MEMTLDQPEESKIARLQIKGRELRKISKDAGNKKKTNATNQGRVQDYRKIQRAEVVKSDTKN